ncbi:MAG: hypothetical protein ACLP1X_07140 [Polyangiaceae bacterium]
MGRTTCSHVTLPAAETVSVSPFITQRSIRVFVLLLLVVLVLVALFVLVEIGDVGGRLCDQAARTFRRRGSAGEQRAEALRAHVAQLAPERVAPMDRGAAGRLSIQTSPSEARIERAPLPPAVWPTR